MPRSNQRAGSEEHFGQRKFVHPPNGKFVVTEIGRDAEDRQHQERAAGVIRQRPLSKVELAMLRHLAA